MWIFGGNKYFVLGVFGYIVGVINLVSKNKCSYWVNDDVKFDVEGWLIVVEEKKGSWWNDWVIWIKLLVGDLWVFCKLGNIKYKLVELVLGCYVRECVV